MGVAAVLSCYRGLRLQTANADKYGLLQLLWRAVQVADLKRCLATARDNGELFEEAVAVIQKQKFEQQKVYVQNQVAAQVRRLVTC